MKELLKFWPHAAAVTAAMAVFSLYTRPEFLVDLANQMWACF